MLLFYKMYFSGFLFFMNWISGEAVCGSSTRGSFNDGRAVCSRRPPAPSARAVRLRRPLTPSARAARPPAPSARANAKGTVSSHKLQGNARGKDSVEKSNVFDACSSCKEVLFRQIYFEVN